MTIDEERLVQQYNRLIWRVINDTHRPQSAVIDTDDLYQVGAEALIKAHRSWVPEKGAFMTWAYQKLQWAIRREVDNARWSKTRTGERLRDDRKQTSEQTRLLPLIDWNSEEAFDHSLDSIYVGQLLNGLSDRERMILLAFYGGRSYADIADELGVSRERIRQIATRGLDKARRNGDD